jgi:hypothetical protein
MISGNRLVGVAIVVVGSLTVSLAFAAGPADATDPCAARASRIDADIAKAKAKGNDATVAKLERERSQMAHCSVDGLKQKRKMALEQAQRRIDLSAADLAKAQASGDAAKIKKAQSRLDSARKSYAEIEKSPL